MRKPPCPSMSRGHDRDARLCARRAFQQCRRRADAAAGDRRAVAHLRREAEIGGYEAAAAARPARGGLRLDRPTDRTPTAARSPSSRTPPAPGTWRSTRFRFSAGRSHPDREAEYASNYIAFLQVARRTGAASRSSPNDDDGQVDVDALEPMLDDGAVKLSRSPTCRPTADWSTRRRRSARSPRRQACPTCSTPASRSARCRSTSRRSAATALRHRPQVPARPARHRLPLRPRRLLERLTRRSSTCTRPPGPRPTGSRSGRTPAASRTGRRNVAGQARPGRRRRLRAGLGARRRSTPRRRRWPSGCASGWPRRRRTRPRPGERRCGIVTFTVDGEPAEAVAAAAAQPGSTSRLAVELRRGSTCPSRGLTELVRASVHYYNTEDEIDRFVAALAALA